MTAKEKINAYFDLEINKSHEMAAYCSEKMKSAKYESERKHYQDQGWKYGVSRPAYLDEIRKDILKLV